MIDRSLLIDQAMAQLSRELEAMTSAARAAHEAATHEESRPEDSHDTRGIEASYLAGAQAERAGQLERQIEMLGRLPRASERPVTAETAIELGALVQIAPQEGSRMAPRSIYWLLAQGGGLSFSVPGGLKVQVITPQAPLGEELLGRKVGDELEVETQGKLRHYLITEIF